MCGIAGILKLDADATAIDRAALRAMADTLAHRGPDDEGAYLDPQGRCGFAFRRLAIIDLATGNQPLAGRDGRTHVVFNGEIYNFPTLRQELRGRGHDFRTQGDAEVIVRAYDEWGTDCFERFEGMFAIALWDETRGRLTLARDRLGQKPLHYAVVGTRLYFASELKALRAVPDFSRTIDPQALHRYLLFQYVPAPHSIYRDGHKLPPGTFVTIERGRVADPQPYWRIPRPTPFPGTYDDAKAQLETLLTTAVEKRLISDVPLGAFLSGGIDSSIIVALMRKLGVSPLRTFSIGFPDARYDETAHARRVAEHFHTEHHEHRVTPQAREMLDTLAYHYDEPFADSSAIPTWYVSQHTRQHVTVALTGDAGDECFAGYDRYLAAALAARFDCLPTLIRRGLAAGAGLLPRAQSRSQTRRLYRFATALGQRPSRRYLSWVNIFTPAMLRAGYREEFAATIDFDEPLHWFDRLYDAAPGPAPNRAIHTDFASYLPYDLLTKVDLASMACSLECRSPFLDHHVIEFALSLPLEWRLGPLGPKQILKDWARELLPPGIIERPKMGFGVPIGNWFRRELADLVRARLLSPDALCQQVFRADWLTALVEAHISGRDNHEHPLWSLLMLELWGQRWDPADILAGGAA